jgi:hypothetical protein
VASSLPRAGDEDSTELVVIEGYEGVGSSDPVEKNPVFCDPGDFVCGFEVYYDDYKATALGANFVDEEGIAEMNIKCCQATDWSIQTTKVVQDGPGGDSARGRQNQYNKFKWARVTCPQDGFVIGELVCVSSYIFTCIDILYVTSGLNILVKTEEFIHINFLSLIHATPL